MSWRHYDQSFFIIGGCEQKKSVSFYSIIMAAMRKADATNAAMLKNCWPKVRQELEDRDNAPQGFLSIDEVKILGEFTDEELESMQFPMKGWPYGA